MSRASQFHPISVADYLLGEHTAKRKHEFVNGVVYAMAGGTVQHSRIASNAMIVLGIQFRNHKCQVYNSHIKIRVRLIQGTRFYYPDLSVVCEPNAADDSFHDMPVIVVEVVSESTRRTDEFEKREAYLSIASLCVYVLVEQSSAAAHVYRRTDNGFDHEVYIGLDAIIPLPEIQCELSLKELYQNVEFVQVTSDEEVDQS
jgi:Uma2 family endonuclease